MLHGTFINFMLSNFFKLTCSYITLCVFIMCIYDIPITKGVLAFVKLYGRIPNISLFNF